MVLIVLGMQIMATFTGQTTRESMQGGGWGAVEGLFVTTDQPFERPGITPALDTDPLVYKYSDWDRTVYRKRVHEWDGVYVYDRGVCRNFRDFWLSPPGVPLSRAGSKPSWTRWPNQEHCGEDDWYQRVAYKEERCEEERIRHLLEVWEQLGPLREHGRLPRHWLACCC